MNDTPPKVEYGIPVSPGARPVEALRPRPKSRRGNWPYPVMRVGDVFVVGIETVGLAAASADRYQRKTGTRFTFVPCPTGGGFEVTRVE